MRRKKTTDRYAEEKRWFFSSDLKEESEDKCQTEMKRAPDHRCDVVTGSLPQVVCKRFWEENIENGTVAEKRQDRKSNRTLTARRPREEMGKRNQMTALRLQTEERHKTSPVSIRGYLFKILHSIQLSQITPAWCCL